MFSSPEAEELYQQVILEHARHPRGRGRIPGTPHRAEGTNPLCGDHLEVFLRVDDGVLRELRFEGEGCAIFTASASLMAERVPGLRVDEVEALAERVRRLVTGGDEDPEGLGKLAVLSGVSRFPMRVKCAALPWHTLLAALHRPEEGEGGAP